MARANLSVSSELVDIWRRVNSAESVGVRFVALAVEGEKVVPNGIHESAVDETESTWWAKLASDARSKFDEQSAKPVGLMSPGGSARVQPQLWMVCSDPAAGVSARWTLVSFVPDGTHPRAKMLYASARDDVKRALDSSRFDGDYFTSDIGELSPAAMAGWKSRDSKDAMTKQEIVQAEVRASVAAERSALPVRMATMQSIPFAPNEDLTAAMEALKVSPVPAEESAVQAEAGSSVPCVVNWLEVRVGMGLDGPASPVGKGGHGAGEALTLGCSGPETEIVQLTDKIVSTAVSEPRFFLVRPTPPGNGSVLMVYHCPELSRPKARMTYSTAKASVTAAAAAAGLPIARTVETRDKDDVNSALIEFSASPVALTGGLVTSPRVAAALGAAGGPGSPIPPFTGSPAGRIALPGMGSPMSLPKALPGTARVQSTEQSEGQGSPATPTSEDTGFSRPTRPGRKGGLALPGMGLPGMAAFPGAPTE